MYYIIVALLVLTLPHLSYAQTTGSLQGLISGTLEFVDAVLIPVILGIAFLMIVWNALRFFIIGADNEESQQNAKNLALYSVLAFVLILSFWGIVAILTNGIGLPSSDVPCEDMQSDYYRVQRSAPCSSLNPPARPYEPVDGSNPGSLVPPGSDTPPTIPGSDVPPTLPGTPTPPTAPTTTPSAYDYKNVSDYAEYVRELASPYFTTTMSQTFGANTTAVKNTLFADLPTSAKPGYSDVDRAIAMYRLQELGVVPLDTVPNFIAKVNLYNTNMGFPTTPLTTASVGTQATAPVTLPATIVRTMAENKDAIITTLSNYDYRNTPEVLNAELFNPALSPNERMQNFKQYYTEGPEYDIFAADIQTEKIFNGDFSPLP
jgi:hypothetical protein